MSKLSTPSPTELQLEARLRGSVVEAVRGRKESEIAAAFGITSFGVKILLRKEAWPLETCLRAAEALGLPIRLESDDLSRATGHV